MRYILIVATVLGVAVGSLYGYYRYKFPYGSTHRCSKSLSVMLDMYAEEHGGNYPEADDIRQLGMEKFLDAEGTYLDLVVGKAGDLAEAKRFYMKNGYLLKDHSSWHYVSGLTTADTGRALAWDKIPLNHNGMREDGNPREVIMVGGIVDRIKESQWENFLKGQEQLAKKQP